MRSRSQNLTLIITLGVLNALTPFSIDMYLPAFPTIAHDLAVPTERLSLSVSAYFFGYAFGQILYGPLLDRFGRRRPLYVGLAIYILGSIGCALSTSLEMLLVCRFLAALGGCASSVGATAMVRDYFPPKDGAKIYSALMLVLSASPLLAPTVGGLVVGFTGWRSLFAVLSVFAVVDLALVALALPPRAESYQPDPGVRLSLGPVAANFWAVLRQRQFLVYSLAGSLAFAGLFVYVAGSPAIYMDYYQVSPKAYSAIFALLAVGMIGGSQLNHLLVKRLGSRSVFRLAMIAEAVLGVAFLVCVLTLDPGPVAVTAFLFLILSATGIASPNGAALALEPFSQHVGSASALLGFLQLGLGSVVAAVVGLFQIKGALPTAASIATSSVLGVVILWAGRPAEAACQGPGSAVPSTPGAAHPP